MDVTVVAWWHGGSGGIGALSKYAWNVTGAANATRASMQPVPPMTLLPSA